MRRDPSSSSIPDETITLVDALLAEQQSLTAVDKFSRSHDRHAEPVQTRYYRDLILLAKPGPGAQYAFEVDLDQCSGCKACVTACHSLNGLDEEETWRNVGLLHGGTFLKPVQRTVTTACHHCVDPACLNGCPVLAYEKDAVTGIVKHLDDQCIGCQYCVLKCPYDVPKYSERLGIVRKCDMCSSRLSAGEAPACVQACPNEAIRITVVDQASMSATYRESASATNLFLPGSPAPAYTVPTTRYRSAHALPESLAAADAQELHPQPAHTPLGFMLVLSQLSVGAFTLEQVLPQVVEYRAAPGLRPALGLAALGIGLLALGISTLHLGRPFGAWRAFLGLRRSWLSREIVVFGAFAGLALLHTGLLWFPPLQRTWLPDQLGWATVVTGWLGVFSSAMLYHDTQRAYWRLHSSGPKFMATATLLGAALALVLAVGTGSPSPLPASLALLVLFGTVAKLASEWPIFRHLQNEEFTPLHKTARLLEGRLGLMHRSRVALGLVGGILMPAVFALGMTSSRPAAPGSLLPFIHAALILLLSLGGELLERRLFFIAVQPVKMPGGIAA